MSIDVMTACWYHAPVKSGDMLILLALADYADENGGCWPSVSSLAAKARMSERNAQLCVGRLVDDGLIAVKQNHGPGGSNRYEVMTDKIRSLPRVVKKRSETSPPAGGENIAGGVKNLRGGGENISGGGRSGLQGGGEVGFTRTVIEPSIEPSSLKKSAGENDEQEKKASIDDDDDQSTATARSIKRAFEKAFRQWPTSLSDSRQAALDEWIDLSPAERIAAAADQSRYVDACKTDGRNMFCAYAVYLREKRWTSLTPAPSRPGQPVEAKPFGKLWMAERLRLLLAGPQRTDFTFSAFERRALEAGTLDRSELMLQKRANQGWPSIGVIDDKARDRRPHHVAADHAHLADAVGEAVEVGSADWHEWREEFARRGWPWLPDPGVQSHVWFPAGGPGQLSEFEKRLQEQGDEDGGGAQTGDAA